MKKLLFTVTASAAIIFSACSSAEKAEENEKTIASKIENCTNPDSLTAYVTEAKDYVQTLVNDGKLEEAKAYLEKIEPVIKDKAPQLAASLSSVKLALDKAELVEAADSLKSAVTDSVAAKADEIKDAVGTAVDNAGEAAKDKASQVANDAADKVGNATQKAADKINGLIKK